MNSVPSATPRRSPLLLGLIVSCVAVYVVQAVTGAGGTNWLLDHFALTPGAMAAGQAWRLLTYMWLHGDSLHLALNMLGLWTFGPPVLERAGAPRFLSMYLGGGLLGGVLWWIFNREANAEVVGASGGVFALVVAFAVYFPRVRLLIFPLPVPVEARWAAVGFAGISIAASLHGGGSVAHLAHLGGMVAGFLGAFGKSGSHRAPDGAGRRIPSVLHTEARAAREAEELVHGRDYVSDEVDAILDKIAREGFAALTPRERRVLAEASRRR